MKWLVGILISFLLGIIFIWIYTSDFAPDNELLEKINKLELKIDSLNNSKDSVRTVIDSIHIKIVTNEKHYQERINTILIQSASSDSGYIADYIRFYSEQNSLFNSK